MKSTSVRYLLPLLLTTGLPVACSGSTDKLTTSGDSAGAGSTGDEEPNGSGGSKNEPSSEGGASAGTQSGKGGAAGTGNEKGGSAGVATGGTAMGGTAAEGGAAEGGGQPAGGDSAGGDAAGGAGGSDGGVVETPVDPTLDGTDDAASGRYRLRYKPTQKCLRATLDGPQAAACGNDAAQQFFLDDSSAGLAFVRVRSVATSSCVAGKGNAIASVVCSEDAQLQFVQTGGGYFKLVLPIDDCVGMLDGALAQVPCTAETVWSLEGTGTNFALKATWTATSTFPGYSTDYAHDGIRDTGLSGHSWANNWQPPQLTLPQQVTIDFGALKQFSQVNVLTSQNYEIGSYDLQYWNGSAWITLVVVQDNVQLSLTHVFPTVVASKLRFILRRGPEAQYIYTRLNEVEIY